MTADEARAVLERLIPSCRGTNPILHDRLPREIRATETLLDAVPLHPRGYLALSDQRLFALDHPPRLATGASCDSLELADVRDTALVQARHTSELTLLLRSGDTLPLVIAGGRREAATFAGRLLAAATAAAPGGDEHDASPVVTVTTVPPPPPPAGGGSDGAPPPDLRELQTFAEAIARRAETLVRSLAKQVAAREGRIARAEKSVQAAGQGRKLKAIGAAVRVVLYEDRITTPDGTFPLTPEVHARCEQQGMVQSVQGWIVKSDQDRREVYLHINGRNWHSMAHWSMKWTVNTPSAYVEMAYAIGEAARRSPEAAAEITVRRREAQAELESVLGDRTSIDAAAADLPALKGQLQDVARSLGALGAGVAEEDQERSARREARRLGALRERCAQAAAALEAEWVRALQAEHSARRRAAGAADDDAREPALERPPVSGLNLADPATSLSAAAAPAPDEVAPPTDVLSQIERLGELHERGLLTAEEFAAAKSELLGRL